MLRGAHGATREHQYELRDELLTGTVLIPSPVSVDLLDAIPDDTFNSRNTFEIGLQPQPVQHCQVPGAVTRSATAAVCQRHDGITPEAQHRAAGMHVRNT